MDLANLPPNPWTRTIKEKTMKSKKLITLLVLMLPGAALAADPPIAVVPEPSILGLIVAGAAAGVLVYRNRRK